MVERRSAYARQRVFIVDDHPLVREWLTNVINQQWDLTVCGESEGREGCIEAIEKKDPTSQSSTYPSKIVRVSI